MHFAKKLAQPAMMESAPAVMEPAPAVMEPAPAVMEPAPTAMESAPAVMESVAWKFAIGDHVIALYNERTHAQFGGIVVARRCDPPDNVPEYKVV